MNALTRSVWTFNEEQSLLILRGITSLPNIEHALLEVSGGILESGTEVPTNERAISTDLELTYRFDDIDRTLGILKVSTSLRGAIDNVFSLIFLRVGANFFKTSLVVAFSFFAFHRLVNRHIILESAVDSRKSAQALDAPSETEKRLITQQVSTLFHLRYAHLFRAQLRLLGSCL